jgi:hypothetical protein
MDAISIASAVTSTAASSKQVSGQSSDDTVTKFVTAFAIQTGQGQVLDQQHKDAQLEQRRQESKLETGET